jgi:hypothetical protein
MVERGEKSKHGKETYFCTEYGEYLNRRNNIHCSRRIIQHGDIEASQQAYRF